jgi:hypothetical protein
MAQTIQAPGSRAPLASNFNERQDFYAMTRDLRKTGPQTAGM